MSTPVISVVSLTWNSAKFIDPLITTLEEDVAVSQVPTEIIVVDNGSRDRTLELLRGYQEQHDNLHVVPLSHNTGTTVPRNIGIRMARGEYVLILDSDTEIPPGTLRGLLEGVEAVPNRDKLGILHPRLIYPDGEFQESARRFPTFFTKFYRLFRMEEQRARDESIDDVLSGHMTAVDYAISACWLVPRTTFDRIGLLDERIFYSPEDVEFCARCWKHGLEVWYYPEVEIIHNCQRITSKKPISKLGLSHMKGLVRYWFEYDSFFSRPTDR
ncbi:glycosyltransferase family 2 protein [Haliangium sp.]|uniref:glycosyltransferase family 2 protein n=1 Tax=Haliangium sp. TaxID=2663208 RepID=UPI003D12C44B